MIVTELISGLGNQLFQYAAGLALAEHHQTELKIDKSWFELEFEKQTPREYGLSPFRLAQDFASKEEIMKAKFGTGFHLQRRIADKLDSMKPYYKRRVYLEPHFHFDPHFFEATKNTYLSGYWQSEKYFAPVANQVRAAFQLKEEMKGLNAELRKAMMHSMSISLHVRRTDMVNNPDVAKTHGSCSLEYYQAAATQIATGLTDPEFFIFSDDPAWCKENLHLNHPVHYIDNNQGEHAYFDMQLMSSCRHHIIANSSFSWWGAWLNASEDKRVIGPKNWFATNERDTSDITPSGWARI